MTKILCDFHQTVIAAISAQAADFKKFSEDEVILATKHMVFRMLMNLKIQFKGELIICTDANKYWRTAILPAYKGHRKHDKEKDKFLDWDLIHRAIEALKEDIRENFNIKVIEVNGAEADDVIACLVYYFAENELIEDGLTTEPQDVVISSTDGDLPQLQQFNFVKQWDGRNNCFITAANPRAVLMEHICTGDSGDNVPNILTGDEWANIRARGEKPPRQAAFQSKKRLPEFIEKGIDACANDEERKNFKRNQWLVDLSMIPPLINKRVVDAYLNYEKHGTVATMREYFTKHNMRFALENLQAWR